MDHLTPSHDGDGSRNTFNQMRPYIHKESTKIPATNDVYVGHIPAEVDIHMLHSLFAQFGEVDRIFEGKKSPGGMKWAFISYIRAEDALKYCTLKVIFTNSKSFATSRENRTCRLNAVPFCLEKFI